MSLVMAVSIPIVSLIVMTILEHDKVKRQYPLSYEEKLSALYGVIVPHSIVSFALLLVVYMVELGFVGSNQ